jgi:mono/diheme cytochrome c family protein
LDPKSVLKGRHLFQRVAPFSFLEFSMKTFSGLVLFAFSGILSGCFEQESMLAVPETPLIARGKMVYQTQCLACHNSDARKPGVVGPDIAWSSQELLVARIMDATYPEGYKPKREGKAMPALPQLKDEIEGLHAFLNAFKK